MQSTAMRETERGPHTVRSHGFPLARTHMHDWLILVLLGAITLGLSVIHPFHRFVGREMMADFRFPHKNDTIPAWAVPIYSLILPIVVFVLLYYRRRDVYDLHHAILGVLFSGIITGVLTEAIKNAVGRPTPDFFWRCFPDGNDVYDHWGGVICHGDDKLITAGYKSAVSGHTSWSFAGLGFLSLYLAGKIKAFDGAGHVAKLCVVLLPLLVSCLIGISRVDDYRHHWGDVFTGGIIGLVVAILCYLQFFPPPYHLDGWRTYAYLRVLEDVRPNTVNALASGGETEIQRSPRNNTSTDANSWVPVQDIETGMR